ncbi:unnamed protein product [Parnassius mnemosyne]|uniref:CCHC-type domain-containing protein n=1 Tax=Parnassius mnemosyne TaxID=213953 RepID=A0AAV1KFI8_9NEOP
MSALSNTCPEAVTSVNLSQEIIRTEYTTNITDDVFEEAQSDSSPNFNDEYLSKVIEHTELIQKTLDGSRSVTRLNKDSIKKSLEEIRRSTQHLHDQVKNILCHSTLSAENKTVSIIKNTIREEFEKLTIKPHQTTARPQQDIIHPPIIPAELQSYASIVKTKKTVEKSVIPITKPALIVTTKQSVSSSQETVNAWRKSVQFKNHTFAPAEVKKVSNYKLRVEFDNQEQRDEILEAINKPDSLVSAEIAKKLKPMVILKGIFKDTPVSELNDIIIKQNPKIKDLINTPEDLTYKFIRNNKNQKLYNAVFMVTPHIWRAIIELQKVNIDHQRVHAEDHPAFLQCYKCMKFGHTKKHCTEDIIICSHCSSNSHTYRDCPDKKDHNKINCHNCTEHANKYKLNSDTKHSATSLHCPRVLKQIEICKNKTDYGYQK